MIHILKKFNPNPGDFMWIDNSFLPNSNSAKVELTPLNDQIEKRERLIKLFYDLFGDSVDNLYISQFPKGKWGEFCIDTIRIDSPNEKNEDISPESFEYLLLLLNSNIHFDYEGYCSCENWTKFLSIILDCIILHLAPYSPMIFDSKTKMAFYFHHTGSIGVYYELENNYIDGIISKAEKNSYEVKKYPQML